MNIVKRTNNLPGTNNNDNSHFCNIMAEILWKRAVLWRVFMTPDNTDHYLKKH